MLVRIRQVAVYVLVMAMLMLGAFMAPHDAGAQTVGRPHKLSKPIAVTGKTADGKYPVYQLEGELDDFNYTSGNIIYSNTDLLGNMVFVDPKDIKKDGEYKCQYVCKDRAGHIVGMNPAYKAMAGQ